MPLNGRMSAESEVAPHYAVSWPQLLLGAALFAVVEVVLTFLAGNLIVMLLAVVAALAVVVGIARLFRGRMAAPRLWFGSRHAASLGLGLLGSLFFLAAFIAGVYLLFWLRSGFELAGLPLPVSVILCWLIAMLVFIAYYRFVEALLNLLAARTVKQG